MRRATLQPAFAGWAALILLLAIFALPVAAQNFTEGRDYWFNPAVFPGRSDLTKHPYGPEKAKGLVIWNHGYSPDQLPPEKVPPVIQYFAEAGWDSCHLQRHSIIGISRGTASAGATQDLTTPLILHVLEKPEVRAYSRVILMGQSRGALATIQTGSLKPKIHGILPLAPAGFGDYGRSNDWRQNDFYIRSLWESYKGTGIHVAAGFFTGDDWYETKQPHVRGPYATKRLTELGVPNFIINQPTYHDMQGHSGGQSWEFARRYGPCLDTFFETGKTPACEDADPATGAVFRLPDIQIPARKGSGYTGVWQGTNSSGRLVRLIIPPLQEERTEMFYQAGLGVNGDKAGTTRWQVRQGDGHLVRLTSAGDFKLYLQNDDRLRVTYTEKGKADEADFGTFFRLVKS